MPATVADIAAATRPAVYTTRESTAVQADWPNARDGADRPAVAYWDDESAASVVCNARFGLLSVARRRFRVVVDGLRFDLLPGNVTTSVQLADAESAAAQAMMVSQVEIDFATGRTIVELWG